MDLWKKSSLLIHYSCCLTPLKAQGTLHITIAIVGSFERVVSLLTHYICYCGSLWKRRTYIIQLLFWTIWKQSRPAYRMQLLLGALVKQSSLNTHCSCSWGPLWTQSTELWCGSENIIWADNKLFTKSEEYLRAKYLEVGPEIRGPKQVLRLPSLLNTSLYITVTMVLYENMKPIEHVLLHQICVLSHLMCACKHCYIKLTLYYWTHWSCWWIYHFKKRRFNAVFHH